MIPLSATRSTVISKMNIYSRRCQQLYTIKTFIEHSIDIDLDTDSNQFRIIVGNPDGVYDGIFNKYDGVALYFIGMEMMHGRIDEVTYIGDDEQDVIEITGRDDLSILIDTDAIPTTLNNANPVTYTIQKCKEYDLSNDANGARIRQTVSIDNIEKVVISSGQSEMSVITGMLDQSNNKIWEEDAYICIGAWITRGDPTFTFTRGRNLNIRGIPIQTLKLRDSALGIKSEVQIYGSSDSGKDKVLGTYRCASGSFYDGIARRSITSSSSDSKNAHYDKDAEYKGREAFRSGIELTITCNPQTMKTPVWVDKIARVIDSKTNLDGTFFIKAVNYTKTITSGSACTVTMVPDDSLLDRLWSNIGPAHDNRGYLIQRKG